VAQERPMTTSPELAPPVMACMEVWGGNQATERSFSMLGLETWIYSLPYQQAAGGGDVYFISSCATGRITRLLIADISGHGASVAETGDRLRMLMRRHVNHIEQRQFLAEMNREFGEVRHSGGFATAVAASFFSPDRRITVTNAGHPPPLLYSGRTGQWAILDTTGDPSATGLSDFPLGMLEEMEYGEVGIDASPGDLLVFYTDSLIESRNAAGDLLGPKGLLSVVATIQTNKPAELIPALLGRIAKLYPENLTDDDVTVLVVRPTGAGTTVPLINRLKAPWLFLGGCVRALLSGNRLPLPEFTWTNFGGSLLDRLGRVGRHGSRKSMSGRTRE
jgi:phosphoserine phosphatase RsbU/P